MAGRTPRTSRWCVVVMALVLAITTTGRGVEAQSSAPKNSAADALYRSAREAMVRGDAKSAIQIFQTVADRYPKTNYATAALYYRAYLQYRQYKPGSPAMLRAALITIKKFQATYPNAAQKNDMRALHLRVCGELARLGDAECRQTLVLAAREKPPQSSIRRVPSNNGRSQSDTEANVPCQNAETVDNAISALGALWESDSAQAIAQTNGVLTLRHPCFVKLRQQALVLLAQRPTPVMSLAPVVFDAARNDPDPTVQNLAGNWLSNQQWDPQAARFLRTIFGHSFRTKKQ